MVTIGEKIEEFKKRYEESDERGKELLGMLAATEHYAAKKIWEYVMQQEHVMQQEQIGRR